jgi:hypothetical protein
MLDDDAEFWEIPMSLLVKDFLVGAALIGGPLLLLWWRV